jgi:hypothetical protein
MHKRLVKDADKRTRGDLVLHFQIEIPELNSAQSEKIKSLLP